MITVSVALGASSQLLADGLRRVASFSEPVRRGTAAQLDWPQIAAVILGLAVAGAVGFWISQLVLSYVERRRHSSVRLFHELCRAHGLNRAEVQVLQRLARFHQLSQPAELFLDPQCFETKRLHSTLMSQAAVVGALRRHLFPNPH